MAFRWTFWAFLLATIAGVGGVGRGEPPADLRIVPAEVKLRAPESSEQVLVFGRASDGRTADVTRQATYVLADPRVARVSPHGQVVPLQDGRTELRVSLGDRSAAAVIEVTGMSAPAPISFQRDVIPILSKSGCNSGACHGKAEGQNGFKLSVFGYDPPTDHQAIVLAGRGRRVFPADPDRSLLLAKATAQIPHGGGQKFDSSSAWYRRVRRWIAEGMNLDSPAATETPVLEVEPTEVILVPRGTQQLRVTLAGSDGTRRCVTAEAEFRSNNDTIASVDPDGWISATEVPGEAAILVRYLGQVAVCRVTRPRDEGVFARPAERNFIDKLVWDKLQRLKIPASAAADDATFLRRVYLDTIGTLPTPAEARSFFADPAPDKRRRLVDALLERPEYADYWAQRWCDLLQADKDIITPQATVAVTRWVRGQLIRNLPYDQFVRSILLAQGSTLSDSPAAFYQVQADAEKAARAVSQLFLGVRIECAQCHHHPFERWDQRDYFAFAGFFTGIERKPTPAGGLKIVGRAGTELKHPRTGESVAAAGLGAAPATLAADQDRRQVLADWVTSPENRYFNRTIANRLWAHYFGRGLVEPIDDLRATNPASNEPLLDALAQHLVEVRYDLKLFTKTLLDSQAYQLSAVANDANRLDDQNYSHANWKSLPAEVLLDAVSQATGVPEEFNGWPLGYRAIQIWDNKLPSHFLEVFGRPSRQTVCACERGTEPSMAQALHLMNAPPTIAKIQDRRGRAAQLAASNLTPAEIIEELYLATLSRLPSPDERQLMLASFAENSGRREAVEDVLWTLLNLREFVYCR